jgi:hypothetical protein
MQEVLASTDSTRTYLYTINPTHLQSTCTILRLPYPFAQIFVLLKIRRFIWVVTPGDSAVKQRGLSSPRSAVSIFTFCSAIKLVHKVRGLARLRIMQCIFRGYRNNHIVSIWCFFKVIKLNPKAWLKLKMTMQHRKNAWFRRPYTIWLAWSYC